MSDRDDTGSVEGTDGVDGQDNAVIQTLRGQIKQLQQELKSVDRGNIEAEVRAQVKRESEAATLMEKAGFPKLAGIFAERVEGELDESRAQEFLADLGLAKETEEGQEGDQPSVDAGELFRVANSGIQGAVANVGADDAIIKRIMEASSDQELAAIMAEVSPI